MLKINLSILKITTLIVFILLTGSTIYALDVPSSVSLSSLGVEGVVLSPAFSPDITSYKASTDLGKVEITAKPTEKRNKITGLGEVVLDYGLNNLEVLVENSKNLKNIYKIEITRVDNRSNNNDLKELTINPGSLSFLPENTIYGVTIDQSVESVSLTAALSDEKAKFVDGYGSPRTIDGLVYGNNAVMFKVIAENGSIKTYTVNVNRNDGRSVNNYLNSLSVNLGQIVFIKDKHNYSIKVPYSVESVEISATAEDTKSKIEVIGGNNLIIGDNIIAVNVVAENGAIRPYTLTINRLANGQALPSNNFLSSLRIGNNKIDLKKNLYNYLLVVDDNEAMIVEPVAQDPEATIVIEGDSLARIGSRVIISVTAQNGANRKYTIKIKKRISIVFLIINLVVIALSVILSLFIFIGHKKSKGEIRKRSCRSKANENLDKRKGTVEIIN